MTETQALIDFLDDKINDVRDALSKEIQSVALSFKEYQRPSASCMNMFVTWGWFRLLVISTVAGFIIVFAVIGTLHTGDDVAHAVPNAVTQGLPH